MTLNKPMENMNNDPKQASVLREYEVTRADLPLSCPMPQMRLWDAHPKVYLPIEATGKAMCPYCDAAYTLKDA